MKSVLKAFVAAVVASLSCGGWSEALASDVSLVCISDGADVSGAVRVDYLSDGVTNAVVTVDGVAILNSPESGTITWQPQTLGTHTLAHSGYSGVFTATYSVTNLAFVTQASANPPMDKVSTIAITPVTRTIAQGGGGAAILTSGSGTWAAAVSDNWITLNSTSGTAGNPVSYMVSVNPDVEDRVGYVYVAGYTHTITQSGLGATVDTTSVTVERAGGSGTVHITPTNSRSSWKARPNCDWISVSPTSGTGEDDVTYYVAPWCEVSTRQGAITVGGNTVTIFQYGSRMALGEKSASCDYYAHVIPVAVNALAITTWSVTPNASWISVVDAGNGKGGDTVSLAVGENPSYKARTGTVTIGTETFTITQEGRTALEFSVSPTTSTASVDGANGLVAVTATPDLPWTAASDANWVTLVSKFASGAGNGNVVYTVSPQSTLYERTATVTVTPEAASGLKAKTHKVTQPAATSSLSLNSYEFAAAGEAVAIEVTVANVVEWKVEGLPSWITMSEAADRVGPGTVTLSAEANDAVTARSATVKIANKTFSVSQKARGVEVEYDTKLFGTDGGDGSLSIHPDGNVSWTAVASDSWIVIWQNDSGTGDAELQYIVAPYTGTGASRTGTITVGDKTVYITQRAYDLSISPTADWVTGNNGAGEIGVSASLGDVWEAIATEPWVTIISNYDSGTGSGVVRFTYTENTTGKTRTAKIVVAGEVYTLTQAARTMVSIGATAGRGGSVSGAGSYDLGSKISLEAVAASGYEFAGWTLPDGTESLVNPLEVTVDVAKSYAAAFTAMSPEITKVAADTNGVSVTWGSLAWAVEYWIWRGSTATPSAATKVATVAGGDATTWLDATGDVGQSYWYWVEAVGAEDAADERDDTWSDPMAGAKQKPVVWSSITYANLRGATNANPTTYQEGTTLAFVNPGAVVGYTFAGWTPSAITADMTGAQAVYANWKANSYTIAYDPNGGSGTMDGTACTYDEDVVIAFNGFTRAGWAFVGWAEKKDGAVVYEAGTSVSNLVSNQNGVITLYAVWKVEGVPAPTVTPADGTVFTGDSCTVTLSCALEGAKIYYRTDGKTPKTNDTYLYTGAFTVADTVEIKAVAVYDEVKSEYVTATITKKTLTLAGALGLGDATDVALTTGGDADWTPVADATATLGMSARSGAAGDEGESWLKATVNGAGVFAFKWKTDCEYDDSDAADFDHLMVAVDGEEFCRADGETAWEETTVTFSTSGEHTICWTYAKDESDASGEDCAWVTDCTWTPSAVVPAVPSVAGDSSATVTGDATSGWTVAPSEGVSSVEVAIPDGVDAAKVTVEVGAGVAAVTPHGAKVKVVRGGHDITDYLDVPSADAAGSIDLTKAAVKEEVVKEAMDPEKGAKFEVKASEPTLTTSATKPGLTYTLREGTTLGGMSDGASKLGDGSPWTPEVKVKGGPCGFYSIKVTK